MELILLLLLQLTKNLQEVKKNYGITADTNDYTFSIFIKSTGGQGQYISFKTGFNGGNHDGNNQVIYDFATDTVGAGYSRELYANGWVRISKTYTNANNTTFIVSNNSSTSLDVLFWGAQVEQGSYPSSLIITSTSANVTRAADVSTSALGVDSFYNQSEGTVFSITSAVTNLQSSATRALYTIIQDSNNRHGLGYRSGGFDDFVHNTFAGGSRQFSPVDAGDPTYTNDKVAYSYSSTGGSTVHNSQKWTSSTSDLSVINPTVLQLGNYNQVSRLNGHIKRLSYFPTRLPDATLQSITS